MIFSLDEVYSYVVLLINVNGEIVPSSMHFQEDMYMLTQEDTQCSPKKI